MRFGRTKYRKDTGEVNRSGEALRPKAPENIHKGLKAKVVTERNGRGERRMEGPNYGGASACAGRGRGEVAGGANNWQADRAKEASVKKETKKEEENNKQEKEGGRPTEGERGTAQKEGEWIEGLGEEEPGTTEGKEKRDTRSGRVESTGTKRKGREAGREENRAGQTARDYGRHVPETRRMAVMRLARDCEK